MSYHNTMKPINWSPEKNIQLKADRGISFEEVLVAISQGGLLDIVDHPNTTKYAHQKIMVVRIIDYACLVSFVETEKEIFLKTIIPNCVATRKYLSKDSKDENQEKN